MFICIVNNEMALTIKQVLFITLMVDGFQSLNNLDSSIYEAVCGNHKSLIWE